MPAMTAMIARNGTMDTIVPDTAPSTKNGSMKPTVWNPRACSAFTRSAATPTRHTKSPDEEPFVPALPMPFTRTSSPSCELAGMSTTTSLADSTRPDPPHASHGSATTLPAPSHSGHSISITPKPKSPVRSRLMWPLPPHVGHVSACSLTTEPLPWHTSHAT